MRVSGRPAAYKVEHTNALGQLFDEQLAAMVAGLEERLARRADQAKLIEGRAVETTALPGFARRALCK